MTMTRLALVGLPDHEVIKVFPATAKFVDLPGCGRVSPPKAGWQGGGTLAYEPRNFDADTGDEVVGEPTPKQKVRVREIAVEGDAMFAIVAVTDGAISDDHVQSGGAVFAWDEGTGAVVETLPETAVPLADIQAGLVAQVKADAEGRILPIADRDKQRNLLAQAAILSEKGRANWTADELAAWDAGLAVWNRIKAIRDASDAIEAAILDADVTTPAQARAAYAAGVWPQGE